MADVRPLAVDDADSIIRTFHFNLHNDEEKPLVPDLTAEEKKKFAIAEKELADEKARFADGQLGAVA